MKILFAGTPEIAVSALKALHGTGRLTGVLTNPDEPVGRKKILTPPPVKIFALDKEIPVSQPKVFDDEVKAFIQDLGADLLISFAYGKIFPAWVLDLFSLGGINIHPSLLPEFRGPSPLSAAILSGNAITGITIQKLALKMDRGDILQVREIPLTGTETTPSLSQQVSELVPDMIIDVLAQMEAGTLQPVPQDDKQASYCKLVRKEDGLINWSESAEMIHRRFRAYQPWPGIHTLCEGQGLIIHSCQPVSGHPEESIHPPGTVTGVDKQKGILIQTGQGLLALTELQLQSRKSADFRSFLNGMSGFIGRQLGG